MCPLLSLSGAGRAFPFCSTQVGPFLMARTMVCFVSGDMAGSVTWCGGARVDAERGQSRAWVAPWVGGRGNPKSSVPPNPAGPKMKSEFAQTTRSQDADAADSIHSETHVHRLTDAEAIQEPTEREGSRLSRHKGLFRSAASQNERREHHPRGSAGAQLRCEELPRADAPRKRLWLCLPPFY